MSVTARRPMTMYSSSEGQFKAALDKWRARMQEASKRRDRDEQRRLALLVEDVADRWLRGEDHNELAASIFAALGN
jgi:hypothetical protein